jgi:fermentation-respiration switch protein FrsA (DUF1100 family)
VGLDESLALEDVKAAAASLDSIATNVSAPLHCPVQLHFGDSDHAIPLADAELIQQARPDVEVHI